MFQKKNYYDDSAVGCEAVSPDCCEAGFVPLEGDLEDVVFEFELVAGNGFADSCLNLKNLILFSVSSLIELIVSSLKMK